MALETPLRPLEEHPEDQILLGVLPEIPRGATEELRLRMREQALTSLYFFARVVLGYDWLTPHTHGALCEFLDNVKTIRRMVLMPRSHLKTTLCTIAQTILDICKNPNVRILIVAGTGKNAQRFMLEIRRHFESNELFRWLFPEIIPENFNKIRWNNEEFEVKRSAVFREPTCDAIGAGANIESRHYDIIRADDLVGEREFQSDAEMETRIDWAGGMEALLLHPECQIDIVGTRWKQADVMEFLYKFYGGARSSKIPIGPHVHQKGPRFAVFSREAIEDGKPIFPEKVPLWYLINFRNENPEKYAAWYANNPKAAGLTTFREEWYRFWKWSEDGQKVELWHNDRLLKVLDPWQMDRIILFDPAVSERKKSARNAIIVVAKGSGRERIILETRIGHYDPSTAVDYLFELDKKWQPRLVSIEAVAYQRAIKYWLEERAEYEDLPFLPIVEYEVESELSKDERIKGLQPLARNGHIWMQEDEVELRDEWDFFPRSTYRDGLDALAQGQRYWVDSTDDEAMAEARVREAEHLSRITGHHVQVVEEFDEQEWLKQFGPTGYGRRSRPSPN